MRIVGGILSGRRFQPPTGIPARPTTDLAREGLFNILNNMLDFEGITALELFSGTGSVSYELASRGAGRIVAVEQDAPSAAFIKKTAAAFGVADRIEVVKGDVFRYLAAAAGTYDLIFADPPYALQAMDELPRLVFDRQLLSADGIFILEHDYRHRYETHPRFLRTKKYGDTQFSFFTAPSTAAP